MAASPAPHPVRRSIVPDPAPSPSRRDLILTGPIGPTLLRLAVPTAGVMAAQVAVTVVETWYVSFLGTDVMAGVALVFPLSALMATMSNGGIGGGVSSAVARASGAGRPADADALALHALVLAIVFGLLFTLGALACGPGLYRAMGGTGGALRAATTFSAWLFAFSVPVWAVNLLAAALRGAGELRLPATVTLAGALVTVTVSPALIFGVGPVPRLGIAGAGLSLGLYYCGAALVLLRMLRGRRTVLSLRVAPLRAAEFRAILVVGAIAALGTVITNLTLLLVTAAVGVYGVAALAGYGIASRLDWLLVPVLFGAGTAVVTMVGVNTGAGLHARARRVAWFAAASAAALFGLLGLAASATAPVWVGLFTDDRRVLATGVRYAHLVAPTYGAFALALMLYFANQGRARMLWPLAASVTRLVVAAGGSFVAARAGAGFGAVCLAVAVGSLAYAGVNACGMRDVVAAPTPNRRDTPAALSRSPS